MMENEKALLFPFFILFLLSLSYTFSSEKKVFLKNNWFVKSFYLVEDGGDIYMKVEGWNIPPRWIPIER